jgi:hypothetical protein
MYKRHLQRLSEAFNQQNKGRWRNGDQSVGKTRGVELF